MAAVAERLHPARRDRLRRAGRGRRGARGRAGRRGRVGGVAGRRRRRRRSRSRPRQAERGRARDRAACPTSTAPTRWSCWSTRSRSRSSRCSPRWPRATRGCRSSAAWRARAGEGGTLLGRDGAIGAGAVGLALSGVRVAACVSQGARPIGPEMAITAGEGNVIHELAGKPAVARLQAGGGRALAGGARAGGAGAPPRASSSTRTSPSTSAATSSFAGSSPPTPSRARSPSASASASARPFGFRCATQRRPTRTWRPPSSAVWPSSAARPPVHYCSRATAGARTCSRRPDHDAQLLDRRDGRARRGVLLRGRDRAGRRPQLRPRVHGDDGAARARHGMMPAAMSRLTWEAHRDDEHDPPRPGGRVRPVERASGRGRAQGGRARPSPALLVLDLRELTFMDSTGLRVMVSADARARDDSRRLVVVQGPGVGAPRLPDHRPRRPPRHRRDAARRRSSTGDVALARQLEPDAGACRRR